MAARRKKTDAPPAAPPPEPALVVVPSVALAQRVGQPCDPARAEPLRIVATLDGPIVSVPMMDSLLAYTVAQRAGLPPIMVGDAYADIDIPVMRSPCGRFHLASAPIYRAECYDTRHRNRRFPMAEAQMFAAADVRRINIQNGATKSFRVPYQQMHLQGDQVLWYVTGDRERIETMLGDVLYLGKSRSVGKGRVVRWSVEPVAEPWPGFPVVADGRPMRPLPLDWPGVTVAERRLVTLSYPYTDSTRRQPCLVGAEA